jgi:hypothetical protein
VVEKRSFPRGAEAGLSLSSIDDRDSFGFIFLDAVTLEFVIESALGDDLRLQTMV